MMWPLGETGASCEVVLWFSETFAESFFSVSLNPKKRGLILGHSLCFLDPVKKKCGGDDGGDKAAFTY